jgi:hypothetical protein
MITYPTVPEFRPQRRTPLTNVSSFSSVLVYVHDKHFVHISPVLARNQE